MIGIAALILILATLSVLIPPAALELHNVLHHLNFLPFMIAGLLFGWRGAVWSFGFAVLVQTPILLRHWEVAPFDAQDQMLELFIFGVAGSIAGFLTDQERTQRKRVVTTKLELERVYTELRQNVEKMKRNERLSAAGQMAARLAHEIRNPLASISGVAGILKRGQASPSNREECLTILEKESQRLNKLLTNFLEFARPRLPRLQPVEPDAIVQSVASLARNSEMLRDVTLACYSSEVGRDLPCDSEQVKQVLLNLLLNAVQASRPRDVVSIHARANGNYFIVEVTDQGCGIAADARDQIFEPFFTTKESGTGLGLAVAANIVQQHNGRLTLTDNPSGGTTFRLELPFEQPSVVAMVASEHE